MIARKEDFDRVERVVIELDYEPNLGDRAFIVRQTEPIGHSRVNYPTVFLKTREAALITADAYTKDALKYANNVEFVMTKRYKEKFK